MKKISFAILLLFLVRFSFAQTVLYSQKFNALTLQTHTNSANVVTRYASVPNGFLLINDALHNNAGNSTNPNKPFHVISPDNTGWAVVYNDLDKDTFLVSTSWTSTTNIAVNRWVITPSVSIQTPSRTVLTWLAKSPDASYPDKYEVYGTTNLNASAETDFTNSPALFALTAGEKSEWTRRAVYLGTQVSNAVTSMRFAYRNNSKDMYQLWIDDIQVLELPYVNDAAITRIETEKYVLKGTTNTIRLRVQNMAAAPINSITLNYQIGGATSYSQTFTYSNFSYLQSDTATFAIAYNFASAGLYNVKAWISGVNGFSDENHTNDTAYFYVSVLDNAPKKTVLMEQFTSANDGQNLLTQDKANALTADSSVIVVNIHSNDSLEIANASSFINEYGKYPSTALFDRNYFSSLNSAQVVSNDYETYFPQRKNSITPVTLSISAKSYDENTRELSFTVNTKFVTEAKGDYRINAYLLENNVCGAFADTSLNGFNQVNDFYNVGWYELLYHWGYYVPTEHLYVLGAWQYKHQNVLVHAFDGFYGSAGNIPNTISTNNQTFQQSFTYTVPALTNTNVGQMWNADNLYIVAFVSEYDEDKKYHSVLNCGKEKVTGNAEFVGIKENIQTTNYSLLQVYPNPSSGIFYFNAKENINNAEVKVFDISGKCLKTKTVSSSEVLDLSDFSEGIYFLKINSDKGSFGKKVIIQKD